MLARIRLPRKINNFVFLSRLCSAHYGAQVAPISASFATLIAATSKPNSVLEPPSGLHSLKHLFSSQSDHHPVKNFSREGNFDELATQTQLICPGCGVHMQDIDPNNPGFYTKPTPKSLDYKLPISRTFVVEESEATIFLKKGVLNELVEPENLLPLNPKLVEKPVVCARCHSLRHYGKVKNASVENLLPDFDFDHTIGRKLSSASGVRSVVLMVVDAADFDGSFPKKVAKLVSTTINENLMAWKEGKSGNVPQLVLVLSKLDLLPSSISPTRLEHWVRQRARECGASKLTSVHMVSAVRDWGVQNLLDDVIRLAGARGNVWAIGAQNAGKSTLINAIGKHVSGKTSLTPAAPITEAPVPGTTLGIIRMEGFLPGKAKLFDTPGLLHPHHIATRLTRDEQKLVQISKELRPRTYRIKVGQTVQIGGLLRLDVEKLSGDSVYITVWASPFLPLHMGKTENADKIMADHFGRFLQPPISDNHIEELGKWGRTEFQVSGNSWDASSVDVAAAGVGWFAIGLKGEATVGVWTYEGIEVILRNALLPHRAQQFEVSGFAVSQLLSESDKASSKAKKQKKKSSCSN